MNIRARPLISSASASIKSIYSTLPFFFSFPLSARVAHEFHFNLHAMNHNK
jgi:hypothetical protein